MCLTALHALAFAASLSDIDVENLLGRNNYKSNFVVVVVSGDWPHLTASETSTVRCCCEIC